ncbi:MAG: hypothetical protein M1325_06450 [Actinobacteria bacterium]|nr:hypothetical protein [Actinomycetota bacterium]
MALKTDQLTSIERVTLAMQHQEADRVPVAPLASGAARRVLGVTYADYAQDAELAAESQKQWMQLIGGDAVVCFLDLSVEAHDFGQEVKFPIEDTPLPLQAISRLIPARYLVHGLRGILLKGNGLDVLWPDLLAMAIFAVCILGLATARFKRRVA